MLTHLIAAASLRYWFGCNFSDWYWYGNRDLEMMDGMGAEQVIGLNRRYLTLVFGGTETFRMDKYGKPYHIAFESFF